MIVAAFVVSYTTVFPLEDELKAFSHVVLCGTIVMVTIFFAIVKHFCDQ